MRTWVVASQRPPIAAFSALTTGNIGLIESRPSERVSATPSSAAVATSDGVSTSTRPTDSVREVTELC